MIVFDASSLVGAALKADGVPEKALLRAEETDIFALSDAVNDEVMAVLGRPKFALAIPHVRREHILGILRHEAVWFEPSIHVTNCRNPKDNK